MKRPHLSPTIAWGRLASIAVRRLPKLTEDIAVAFVLSSLVVQFVQFVLPAVGVLAL